MSKLDGLDINLMYNNLIKVLNEMHQTDIDTGVSFTSLPDNNVLTINLQIQKPQQLQIPGLINVTSG